MPMFINCKEQSVHTLQTILRLFNTIFFFKDDFLDRGANPFGFFLYSGEDNGRYARVSQACTRQMARLQPARLQLTGHRPGFN